MGKTAVIKGKNVFGDEREYTFNLMTAEVGLEVFHEYVSIILTALPDVMTAFPKLKEFISKAREGLDKSAIESEITISADMLDLAKFIPEILTLERVKALASNMLPGAVVNIDGKPATIGDDGYAEYMVGDPLEIYLAIAYGLQANYPKYFAFLASGPE